MDYHELKYIAEFPRYAGTADGRIYSFKNNQYLKPITKSNGYQSVGLYSGKGRKPTQILVHRIIAGLFCPRAPQHTQVNHKNGDKTDNRAANLEWCTASHNNKHAYDTGLNKNRITNGEGNPKHVLTDEDVRLVKDRIKTGWRYKDIAKEQGVSYSCIAHIATGRTWTHI